MEKDPRYVVCRKIGSRTYWYWQRKGFKTERLPDHPAKRRQRADALNALADADKVPEIETGSTVRDVVRSYERTERYRNLADGTRSYYDRYLRELLRAFGHVPFRQMSRRVVVDFVKEGRNPGEQHKVRGVLSVVFDHARYLGFIETNQTDDLNLSTPSRRNQMWEPADINAFLAEAENHEQRVLIRRYFFLCRFTAQRPGDVAVMQWGQYSGSVIRLRQRKTGKLVVVPCHSDLKAELDAAARNSIHMFAAADGAPLSPWRLAHWERGVRDAAGLTHLQIRDLRRTAMVRMAEAGAEITDIAAVSGHTIAATVQILETYLPRTQKMAERGILAWQVQKNSGT